MSMGTVFAVQDAIRTALETEEVHRLAIMLQQHRHSDEVTDSMYEDGISTLVSMVAAATAAEITELLIPKDEYKAMVDEYHSFTVDFNNNEEE
jgi:hypothetical protein